MNTILAFGASNSKASINKQFAWHTGNLINPDNLLLVDLNDYEMPMFSVDYEAEYGVPESTKSFTKQIEAADGIIISFAEHNGNYSAVFKNIFDWVSRFNSDVWKNKPMLLLATSPGGRGAQTVLGIATDAFSRFSGDKVQSFSLPFFGKNFDAKDGIIDPELRTQFNETIKKFSDLS